MRICARSWSFDGLRWDWCSLPKGHAGDCASDGRPKPDAAKFYEDMPESAAAIQKQIDDERRTIAKKAAGRLGGAQMPEVVSE